MKYHSQIHDQSYINSSAHCHAHVLTHVNGENEVLNWLFLHVAYKHWNVCATTKNVPESCKTNQRLTQQYPKRRLLEIAISRLGA
jgi:hypothetical protein